MCTQLHENGKYAMGDFNATAGKTVVALGRLLTGAQVGVKGTVFSSSVYDVQLCIGDRQLESAPAF